MRRSHSYSKREFLDRCLRQFFYEYYAASKKLPFDSARKPLVQKLKEFTGVYLLAGEKLHWFIEQFLKKGPSSRDWAERTCTAGFDLAVRYSRDPEANAGLQDLAYPPPMLLEFYYGDPRAEELAEKARFTPIRSLLVLRDGRLCGEEEAALVEAIDRLQQQDRLAQDVTADFAEVHKKTVKKLRMWLPKGQSRVNVLEGQAIYLDGEAALLSCTGAATLARTVTADPCLLMLRRGRDVRRTARAFFALSQLNYSSPGKAQRYAHPIRETDSRLQQRMAEDMRGVK